MTEAGRVFISHSAADTAEGAAVSVSAHEVRIAIRKALETAGITVLIDEADLKAGDAWRARINLWMGLCDAAVLILSPNALTSHYVAYEANILSYRRSLDAGFRIIPVLIGVTLDDIPLGPLKAAGIGDWQKAAGDTPEQMAASALERLAGLVPSPSRSKNVMAQVLEPMLPKAPAPLTSAAAVLNVADLPWENDSQSRRLALRLLGSGMSEECAKAIRYFPDDGEGFRSESLESIGELIAAAWVDLKVRQIWSNVRSAEPQPILLNAEKDITAKAYVTAATYLELPYLRIRLVEAPLVLPEQGDPEGHEALMTGKIRAELESKTRNGETLAAMLARAKKYNEGVVVIVHEESLTPALLPKLRSEFEHVTFFVLWGAEAGRIAGPDVLVVTPELAADDEKEFLARYDTFIGDICSA
jgi:hypothetical protein